MDIQSSSEWLAILSGFGSKSMGQIGFLPFLGVMTLSLFSSFLISLLYVRFYKPRSTGSLVYRAFPLLSTSITAIFISIQFSLPLSLGLLGALSIVRFRTPIKEPEEIGFIMLVVASALSCATFNLVFLFILLGVSVIALYGLHYGRRFLNLHQNDGMLVITLPTEVYHQLGADINKVCEEYLQGKRLDSLVENNDLTVISYNYARTGEDSILRLQEQLRTVNTSIVSNVYNNNVVI